MEIAPLHDTLADAPAGGIAQFLTARDGTRIRVAHWEGGTRGTVLLMPGRTEFIEKYGLTIARLIGMGFAVVCIDWRGQGLSTRIHGTTELGHVEHFDEYQQDVELMMQVAASLPRPLHLFAHSMGGCIGLRALIRGLPVISATFSAPMWGLHLPAVQGAVAPFAVRMLRTFGRGQDYAPGARGAKHVKLESYEGNPLTTDPEQYARMRMLVREVPDLDLGPPSVGWLAAAFDEMAALYNEDLPPVPMLAGCGTDETVVAYSDVVSQLERAPVGAFLPLDGARHELFMETPALQDQFWSAIETHIQKCEAIAAAEV
ncbi:alpha/beta hydrolase [Roseobacter sp. HKCCA0434]|uniref:alpha/beta hydrolase n=1 Tax=Roseobacter sp. HKCCA0434 TaxID=3079297 RepID=UPI002905A31E|nr:alpha/beta hydrolase [Roseobacter sp. HKCCA0434]